MPARSAATSSARRARSASQDDSRASASSPPPLRYCTSTDALAEAGRREHFDSPTHMPPPLPRATARIKTKARASVFSKRKGVRYRDDGAVLSCRFCEILRLRDEPFLYEDDRVAVFRPLRPIVPSHILIVPRAHIRNIHQLTRSHDALLRHMKLVAESVLRALVHCRDADSSNQDDTRALGASSSSSSLSAAAGSRQQTTSADTNQYDPQDTSDHDAHAKLSDESSKHTDVDDDDACSTPASPQHTRATTAESSRFKFAFHVPPFNSIDHVHMHAFQDARMGVFGRVKYRTESWWCRSYDDVLAQLTSPEQQQEELHHPTPPTSAVR